VERVRVGPHARAQDVLAHAELIKQVERYNGLLGKLRKLFDRISKLLGRPIDSVDTTKYPHGSRGWVLAKEVEKVQQHLEQTKLDAANGQVDALAAEGEIEFLTYAERFFTEQLQDVDTKAFDNTIELSRPGPSTVRAQKAGYKLPGEPGVVLPPGVTAYPDDYYYRETRQAPACSSSRDCLDAA
jgi:hypothetical protein